MGKMDPVQCLLFILKFSKNKMKFLCETYFICLEVICISLEIKNC